MRSKYLKKDPKVIVVKFDGLCAETGRKINKGERVWFHPESKNMYCSESKQAAAWDSWAFDCSWLGCDY